MSRTLIRDKEKALQFEVIAPDEVRKRARASQTSGLTSSLSRSLEAKPSLASRSGKAASTSMQKRSSQQDLRQHGGSQIALNELADALEAGVAESGNQEVISPGSRPIQRKPRLQKRSDEPRSELSRSVTDEDFVPPHILSFPARTFDGPEMLSSRPGSLYEGAGRKLRGMDAVRFRRNVMRQTGFLEANDESAVR